MLSSPRQMNLGTCGLQANINTDQNSCPSSSISTGLGCRIWISHIFCLFLPSKVGSQENHSSQADSKICEDLPAIFFTNYSTRCVPTLQSFSMSCSKEAAATHAGSRSCMGSSSSCDHTKNEMELKAAVYLRWWIFRFLGFRNYAGCLVFMPYNAGFLLACQISSSPPALHPRRRPDLSMRSSSFFARQACPTVPQARQ